MDGPDVMTPGLLRALRAEARQQERSRLLDKLVTAEHDAWIAASRTGSRRPHTTAHGYRARAMRQAMEALQSDEGGYFSVNAGESYAYVSSAADSIEIYEYDPVDGEDEPEEWPIRIVVCDGAESTTASAYLTLEEAEQHADEVIALVAKVRAAREQRAAVEHTSTAAVD